MKPVKGSVANVEESLQMQGNAPAIHVNPLNNAANGTFSPDSWPEGIETESNGEVPTLRTIVEWYTDAAFVSVSPGKYLDRATIDLYEAGLPIHSVKSLINSLSTLTDWFVERVDWRWRGSVLVGGLFLIKHADEP